MVHVCNPGTGGQTKIHRYIGQGYIVRYFFSNKQVSKQNTTVEPPYDAAVPFLTVYLKDSKSVHTEVLA